MIRYGTLGWQRRSPSQVTAEPLAPGRQWLLGSALALALLGITARLAYWQLVRGPDLAAAARWQEHQAVRTASGRGEILDRQGTILALTVTRAVVVLDPLIAQQTDQHQAGTLDRTAGQLSAVTGVPTNIIRPQLALPTAYHLLTDVDGTTVELALDTGAHVQAAIDAGVLPGTVVQSQLVRTAPLGNLAGPVLGFVRGDTGAGQYGIEERDDALLADVPGQPGATLTLTLDANLQYLAESELRDTVQHTGAAGGTVIALDPATGEILALATTPGFDPGHYSAAPLSAYADPALAAVYDPGSTMKAITLAAGLDCGVITPDTTLNDTGNFTVGGQTIHNFGQMAWGTETMTQVLTHSSNVGAAWVAVDQLGHERFAHYLNAFGFGAPTGVDLPGEVAGLLPPPAPTPDLANLDLAENAFGESIGVTPLQMVMAYGAIANGGVLLHPQIVRSITRDGQTRTLPPTTVRRVIGATTATTLTNMLVTSALHSDAQTGLIAGYQVAAKTGTSTPDPADPSVTIASVLGFAPAQHPRFVLLVKLDQPRTAVLGGEAAGPLWRMLARQILAYEQVPVQGGN